MSMAFSTQVRREAARVPVEKKCCARAELAAAVLCYALSVLILQAAEMKEEADLTI